MTRARQLRERIIVVTALGAVTVFVLLITHRSQAPPLSLLFERYGTVTTMDLFVQDVAFLRITNSSDKTYYVAMGPTNTHLLDAPIGFSRKQSSSEGSYMPLCEFRDQPPIGSTHPPVSFAGLGLCVSVGPHSAVRLRVALPPEGQKRKVAVLCMEPPPGTRPFWTSSIGGTVLRVLPRSVARKAMQRLPAVLRVWCDRELSHDRARTEMNGRTPPNPRPALDAGSPLGLHSGRLWLGASERACCTEPFK
jgi:hypothetical protein